MAEEEVESTLTSQNPTGNITELKKNHPNNQLNTSWREAL